MMDTHTHTQHKTTPERESEEKTEKTGISLKNREVNTKFVHPYISKHRYFAI